MNEPGDIGDSGSTPRDILADFLARYDDQDYRQADVMIARLWDNGYAIVDRVDYDDAVKVALKAGEYLNSNHSSVSYRALKDAFQHWDVAFAPVEPRALTLDDVRALAKHHHVLFTVDGKLVYRGVEYDPADPEDMVKLKGMV